jgi:DNA polymerase III subunit epsilon
MPNRLFFDTETTGKANFNLPAKDPSHPHIVQLAAILDNDERVTVGSIDLIISPDGFKIPEEVAKIHGIDEKIAASFGFPEESVLILFCELATRADELIAHNFDFDALVVAAQLHRLVLLEYLPVLESKKQFCTMKAATPICKIPSHFKGKSDYKWPGLQEAHVTLVGSKFDDAHDAMADVRACRAIYYAMLDRKKDQP